MAVIISFAQTPHERYVTNMNKRVRNTIRRAKLDITEEWGGSEISDDPNALVADQNFTVDATLAEAMTLQSKLEKVVGREVRFEVPK